eukprot:1146473-Pelagomonas_calceolata.AAC.1
MRSPDEFMCHNSGLQMDFAGCILQRGASSIKCAVRRTEQPSHTHTHTHTHASPAPHTSTAPAPVAQTAAAACTCPVQWAAWRASGARNALCHSAAHAAGCVAAAAAAVTAG